MKEFLNKMILEPLRKFSIDLKAFLPNFLSSIIILIAGLLAAYLAKLIVIRVLNILNADRFFNKIGFSDTLKKTGMKDSPTRIIARVVYYIVLFVFIIIALYALKVPAVDALLGRLLLYMPNLFVSLFIIIIGSGIGNFLSRAVLIGAVNAGIKHGKWLSQGVKLAVLVFVVTMALEQLGIGKETVITAFTIIFGGIVFALALGFGLASKDIFSEYIRKKLQEDEEEEPDELKHL